jgi:hypothetical protein
MFYASHIITGTQIRQCFADTPAAHQREGLRTTAKVIRCSKHSV